MDDAAVGHGRRQRPGRTPEQARPGRDRGRPRGDNEASTSTPPPRPGNRFSVLVAEPPTLVGARPQEPFDDNTPPWQLPPGAARRRRREERRAQQAALRRRLIFVGALVAMVALVGATVAILRAGGDESAPVVKPRTQQTMLLQVRGTDGTAVTSALLATDPAAEGGQDAELLLVPDEVLTAVPSNGTMPFRRALTLPDADASRAALEDLAGVVVDRSLVIDAGALTDLIDQLGGITADVPSDLVATNPDGSGQVLLAAGPQQHLDGAQAMQLLAYRAPGEQSVTRLPRAQQVLQGLLTALPVQPAQVSSLLTGLGGRVSTGGSGTEVATMLTGIAGADKADRGSVDVLPVTPVDTGADEVLYRIDRTALSTLVQARFADSRPAGDQPGATSVFVLNGVGTPGLGTAARSRLGQHDLGFVGSANAATLDHAASVVVVRDGRSASIAQGRAVAAALGLPPGTVRVGTVGQTVADVLVVLGADFTA